MADISNLRASMLGLAALQAGQTLIQLAGASRVYRAVLPPVADEDGQDIIALHDRLARAGGMRKHDCFSPLNITHSSYFASTYRGITSGRSSRHYEYLKGPVWLDKRDQYRRLQLSARAGGDYAVINVASRLFPHDRFDLTLVSHALDPGFERRMVEILAYLASRGLHIFWRGFPARLLENIQQIQRLCAVNSIRRTSLITTGSTATSAQLQALNWAFRGEGLIHEYGAQDCGIQLYSCPSCGCFHANNPRSLITVVSGRLYATDLYSFTQPVIAMATGDLATLHDSTCSLSAEPGFMPRPMPGGLLRDPGQRLLQAAAVPRRSFLLTAAGADSGLCQLIHAAGLQATQSDQVPGSTCPEQELDRLVCLAAAGQIAACRDQLEVSLSRMIRARFARQHTSLIAYLIGHLMLVTASDWRRVLEIWIPLDPLSASLHSEAMLRRTLSVTMQHAVCCAEELRLLHFQATELLVVILADDRPGEQLIGSASLTERLAELCSYLVDRSDKQLSLALPILCSLKDYLLAHLWGCDHCLMLTLAEAWKGSDNSRIRMAEASHRAGLLRKT